MSKVEGRNTTCTIIIGAQRTGKTTFAKKLSDAYEKKVLVVCPDDMEPAWRKYNVVTIDQVPGLTKGRHRIVYDPRNKDFLTIIIDQYKDGMLIWDDAKAYFNNNARIFELEAMLLRRRQFNLDILFMYHGFSATPPALWTYATHLALFRTNDAYERAKQKIVNYEDMVEAMEHVRQECIQDPYYHLILPLQI